MRIEFVNHASFVIEAMGLRLIADPWLEGRVFDEGWALLSPTRMRYEDFADITHIWFSHEHPDHFFPPNLKRIPAELRARIVVLFQKTTDGKVVDFCRRLGFGSVQELEPGVWTSLAPGFDLLCRPLGTQWAGDSWLAVRSPEGTVLNINDCGVGAREAAAIREEVGAVDLLATQFSYAAWQGNVDAVDRRRANARHVLDEVKAQLDMLKPRHVLPLASFVWFCATDNDYLNADMNPIRAVADEIRSRGDTCPVVLYPGDTWTLGAEHDCEPAIRRYEADRRLVDQVDRSPRSVARRIEAAQLLEKGRLFRDRFARSGSAFLIGLYLAWDSTENETRFGMGRWRRLLHIALGRVRPALLWTTDLSAAFTLDHRRGLVPSAAGAADCDVALASGSLALLLEQAFGGETLQINGRFQENPRWPEVPPWSYASRLFLYCRLLRRFDLGYRLDWRRILGALGRRLGRR